VIRCFLVLGVVLCAGAAFANPVSESVANEFNALPKRVVERGSLEDRRQLIANYGAFGIDLLRPATLAYMDRHFEQLRDELAESQRPPHAPSYRLQDWYRARARTAADRAMMLRALRAWLDQPVREAPIRGSMRVVYPGDHASNAVMATRLVAAELLADWSDRDALPAIRALKDSLMRHPGAGAGSNHDPALCLRQSILRLAEPERAGFVVLLPSGRIACRRALDGATAVEGYDGRSYRALDPGERARLAALLNSGERAPSSNWVQGPSGLRITYPDGLVAQLSATESGVVRYEDNSRMTYRESLAWKNPPLHEFIKSLAGGE
jgi:hypothetical protein